MKFEVNEYKEILKRTSVFSPDIDQAQELTGLDDASEMASVFIG